ncbi:SCO family protein [Bacillus mesophilum]|uniref:SCO family protein n=1 Tax=Bacillus mesophilum TaxID=1071718 RepID=A0A7V7RK69_9BACI|nr:SCO family protein [Bacillus mesophilum]KAB2331461.1 SCO family protein [Bacillus mesophilum]
MKITNKVLILLVIFAGFFLVYWLWPSNDGLPILDEVDAFELDDVHGDRYQSENGKVKLVAFFYTNCPDICPLTMMDFKIIQSMLKDKGLFGDEVELVSITLDPAYDTQEVIKEYAQIFETDTKGWKWLRDTPEKIKEIAGEFQMQYELDSETVLYHSTTMYLVDEENNIRALYDMAFANEPVKKDDIVRDIELLAGE